MELKSLIDSKVLAVLVVSVLAGLVVQSLPRETAAALTAETGVFEVASAIMYGLAAVLAAVHFMRQRTPLRLAGVAMLLWAFMRELDFQKHFTYRSVESIGYYVRPYASWSEKAAVLLILAPFVVAGCYLLIQFWRHLRPAYRNGEKWLAHVASCFVLGVASSTSEKLVGWRAAEEVFETGLAATVLMLTWNLRARFGGDSARGRAETPVGDSTDSRPNAPARRCAIND